MVVEVVWALPDEQIVRRLTVSEGVTAREAIDLSGINLPNGEGSNIGIWGKRVAFETILKDGDRVEIYRNLQVHPQDARRIRARKQQDRDVL